MAAHPRLRRFLFRSGKVLLSLLGALLVLLVLAVLSLNLPAARRMVATRVTVLLHDVFLGRLVVEEVGFVSPFEVRGLRVRVVDSENRQALLAAGVSARFSAFDIVRSVVSGNPDIVIDLERVAVDYGDVSLDLDGAALPRIARAFLPRPSSAPPGARTASSGGVRLSVIEARIRHVWLHGDPGGVAIDADADQLGARVDVTPALVTATLAAGTLTTRGLPRDANLRGTVAGGVTAPTGPGVPVVVEGNFSGEAGGAPVTASATLAGADLHGEATLAKTRGDAFARLLPEVPLNGDVDARMQVDGPLEALGFTGLLSAGSGQVALRGVAGLGTPLRVSVHAEAKSIDLAAFGEALPSSALGGSVEASFELPDEGAPSGSFEARARRGVVGGTAVPAVALRGTLEDGCLRASGKVDEPGVDARFDLAMRDPGAGVVLDTNLAADVADLRRVTRVGPIAEGRAGLRAALRLDLGAASVEGHVTATASDVVRPPLRLRRAAASAEVHGPMFAPRVEATLAADDVALADRSWTRVVVSALGTPRAASVHATLAGAEGTPNVTAHSTVSLAPELSLSEITLAVGRDADRVDLRIARLEFSRGVRLDGLSLSGAGDPASASLRFGSGEAVVQASATNVDVGVLARVLGERRPVRGKIDLDVDLRTSRGTAEGRLAVEVRDAAFGKITGASARVDAELKHRTILSTVRAKLGPGHVDIDTKGLELDGSPFAAASWKRSTGTVDLATDVDLERLRTLLPDDLLPFDELTGRLLVRGTATRASIEGVPELTVSVRTESLHVAGKSQPTQRVDGSVVRGPAPWRSTDVDVALDATIGGGGATDAHFSVLDGRARPIASLDFTGKIPYRELASAGPLRLRRLEAVPFTARVTLPERRIEDFPAVFRAQRSGGRVSGLLTVEGTLVEPRVEFGGALRGFEVKRARGVIPIDTVVAARFEGGEGSAEANVDCAGSRSLTATATFAVQPRELLAGVAHPHWRGRTDMEFAGFPLKAIPALDDRRIRGRLDGRISAALGSDGPPEATLALDAPRLSVGESRQNAVHVRANLRPKALDATLSVVQEGGQLDAKAAVDLGWKGGLPDPERASLSVHAKGFRARLVAPVLEAFVRDVDGRVDGDVSVDIDRRSRTAKLRGALGLEDGVFQLPSVGEEFRNVKARLVLESGGIIRLQHVSGQGATGRFTGNAAARFSGFELQGARAELHVPKEAPLAAAVEGETLAQAWADVTVDAKPRARGGFDVIVRVPRAGAELPPRSAHEVQALASDEHVRIGTYRTPHEFLLLPLGPKVKAPADSSGERLRVLTELSDVEVRRESDLRVRLTGKLEIEPEDPTRVEGKIRFVSGFIDVQGKRFEIEQGTATFLGDPANPEVVVTAGWTAPDGTRVYAAFVGPLKTGKVSLRSEPSRTKNEILSLILFGTADGGAPGGTAGSAGTSAAVGLGGGIATQGLNRALDDLTGLDVTTRVDTTESANPRPEVEVRIARDISLAVSHALGVPPPGTSPDKNFATLDWRFRRNWSIETTFGDAGSSILDVIWQYRY